MADPSAEELAAIAAQRSEMFRPAWLGRLFRGQLSLGETFWGGHLGLQLVLMPLWLALIVVLPLVVPALSWISVVVFFVLTALISAGITRAVFVVAPKSGTGAMRWAAMAVSLLLTAQNLALLVMWFRGDL